LDERVGTHNRPVDVRLGSEIDNRVDFVLLDGRGHRVCIADIASHKPVAGIVLHIKQVIRVAGVSEFVVYQDVIVRVLAQQVVYEIRPNETGAAGDHDVSHAVTPMSDEKSANRQNRLVRGLAELPICRIKQAVSLAANARLAVVAKD
jgi:hypothetical protein